MKYNKQQKILIKTLKKAVEEKWDVWEWLGWYLGELELYFYSGNKDLNIYIQELSKNTVNKQNELRK